MHIDAICDTVKHSVTVPLPFTLGSDHNPLLMAFKTDGMNGLGLADWNEGTSRYKCCNLPISNKAIMSHNASAIAGSKHLEIKTVAELRKQAVSLGASSKGSKKDLIKRIYLFQSKQLNTRLIPPANIVPALDETDFLHAPPYKNLDEYFRNKLKSFSIVSIHEYFQVSYGIFQIRAYCSAAMKKSTLYQVRFEISVSLNRITKAECDCVAGMGKSCACKHMSALVCCVEDFIATGTVLQDYGCTNALQAWHKPPKSAPKELVNKTVDEMMTHRMGQKGKDRVEDTQQLNSDDCSKNYTKIFIDASINAGLALSVHSSRLVNMDGLANDHCYLAKTLYESTLESINTISLDDIHKIEQNTRDQNNSDLWHAVRKSRITASSIKNIFTAIETSIAKGNPCNSNPAKINFKPRNLSNIPQIKWGQEMEAEAFSKFLKMYNGEKKFRRCGIFIDNLRNYLAASPDGICCCMTEIIEIKCPYSIRDDEPYKATFLNDERQLKKNHRYYYQIQFQLLVTKAKLCHFVVFTTKGIQHEEILFDREFVVTLLPELDIFYKNVFCKEYCKEFGFNS